MLLVGRIAAPGQNILGRVLSRMAVHETMDLHYELNELSFVWDASSDHEARDAAIGSSAAGHLLFVIHIEIEGESIRITSARKLTNDERQDYEYS